MIKRKRKNSKGFTLVEILLVIGLMGLVSGGIYSLYSKTDETNSAIEETKRLVTYANLANASAGSSGTYSHVDIPYIKGMGVEVNRNLGLSEISSPSPQRLEFKYTAMPSVVCSQMSLKILGTNIGFDVIINGKAINKNEDLVTQVTVACSSNLSNVTYALNSNLTGASLTNEANVGAYDYNAGNASSKSNTSSWNSSVSTLVPNFDGSSFSSLTTDNKYGYLGGVGSISSTPTIPVNNPRPPPTTGINTGDPYNGGSPGNVGDRNAKITIADLTLRIGEERYTKVTAEDMNFVITGLNPTQSYSLQISSRAFNLSSVNPVMIGSNTDTADELNINFVADDRGNAQIRITDIFDISQYFVVANREMEDTTPSMKDFFENTLETLPFFADVISQKTGQIVTDLEFKPIIIFPNSINKARLVKECGYFDTYFLEGQYNATGNIHVALTPVDYAPDPLMGLPTRGFLRMNNKDDAILVYRGDRGMLLARFPLTLGNFARLQPYLVGWGGDPYGVAKQYLAAFPEMENICINPGSTGITQMTQYYLGTAINSGDLIEDITFYSMSGSHISYGIYKNRIVGASKAYLLYKQRLAWDNNSGGGG